MIVSTDCEEIAEVSRKYGIEVIIRPQALAQDETPTLPVLQDVVFQLSEKYDAVMTLQPTSPLRTVKHIDEAINLFGNNSAADSLVSVVEVPHSFVSEKLMKFDGQYLVGSTTPKRRQDTQIKYARNGAAIYITKIDKLQEYIYGGKIIPYFMKKIESFDIDDMEDWKIIERIL